MKVHVDYNRCEGHGLCEEQAAALFSLDDEGDLTYHHEGSELPPELVAPARAAIQSCPVAALREL